MKIISDTGPIIALAKVDRLDLLKSLFERVTISSIVHKELMSKFGEEWNAIERALHDFIDVEICPSCPEKTKAVLEILDEGEQQTIALASSVQGDPLIIIDDKKGREAARKLGLPVTGIVGVLLVANEKGLINDPLPLLRDIRSKGYWLSDELLEEAKRLSRD